MKILIVTYYPLPALGGIWRFVSQLKERLERLGHKVDILSHNPDATKYRIIGRKPEISISQLFPFISGKLAEAFPALHSNRWIYNVELYRYSLELSALYYDLKSYDIIHAQDVMATRAIRRVKPKKIPLVTSVHGYLSGAIFYHLKTIHPGKTDDQLKALFEYKYHKALESAGYQSSDFIHTQSKWMRGNLVNKGSVSREKLFTFPYGMDIEAFLRRSREQSPISRPKGKKVILFTGRLVYLKGIHHLLDALALLKMNRNDWECWILGEGALQSELQGQCRRLGLAQEVKFLGVSNNVPQFLKQADIFVLPSLQDSQPLSLMEAQLIGVPVIVSDAAGLPEMVVNGETGLIAPSGDSQQLYERLKYLLENDSVRKQLASRAKVWAQDRWSMDTMVNHFLAMYQHAMHH